jgi:hypothetical protein
MRRFFPYFRKEHIMAAIPNVSDPSGQGNGVDTYLKPMPVSFQIKDGDTQETINHKTQLQSTWETMSDDAYLWDASKVPHIPSFL